MTTYALLLERKSSGRSGFQTRVLSDIPRGPSPVEICLTCAVVGEPSGYYGKSRTFRDENALVAAFTEADIAVIPDATSGNNVFAYITYERAQSLGLLEAAPH